MRRYYGRHYYGGENENDVLRYYGRKNGNNFRYYFIIPAEAFSRSPLYYHNFLNMDEYPLETNRMLADMEGLQGNTPSYDIQEPVTGETVVRDFSSSPQEIIGEIVDAASKSTDIVSHEVSVQSIDEYPVEINTINPDMDGLQGNTPSYDIQEPVTDETVVRDFSSSPQETIGEIVDVTPKSISILSHKAIVQSKESHMPRTLLTHPRIIRMFQVVGFESLSVSNPNLAVGRLTVLKNKRCVPNKNQKHICTY